MKLCSCSLILRLRVLTFVNAWARICQSPATLRAKFALKLRRLQKPNLQAMQGNLVHIDSLLSNYFIYNSLYKTKKKKKKISDFVEHIYIFCLSKDFVASFFFFGNISQRAENWWGTPLEKTARGVLLFTATDGSSSVPCISEAIWLSGIGQHWSCTRRDKTWCRSVTS